MQMGRALLVIAQLKQNENCKRIDLMDMLLKFVCLYVKLETAIKQNKIIKSPCTFDLQVSKHFWFNKLTIFLKHKHLFRFLTRIFSLRSSTDIL